VSQQRQATAVTIAVFVLSAAMVYMCTHEAYRQLDVGQEMDAALCFSEDTTSDHCILNAGPAHETLSALTGDDIGLWCDSKDGSCAVRIGGKVIDARCALGTRRAGQKKTKLFHLG